MSSRSERLAELSRKYKGKTSRSGLTLNPRLLLHPNIPKPLHTVNPRTIKGNTWWNAVRTEAYNLMGYHCHACGHLGNRDANDFLEAHEIYDIDYNTGRVTFLGVAALCSMCHKYIHSGMLEVLLDRGDISKERYNEIKEHGFRVLSDAGLPTMREEPLVLCEWGDWYLELDGKRYCSPFKDIQEWAEEMGRKDQDED